MSDSIIQHLSSYYASGFNARLQSSGINSKAAHDAKREGGKDIRITAMEKSSMDKKHS